MYAHRHITIIIPALNEARAVGRVIDAIPEFIDRVIVVDNGSEDETAHVAKRHGADVVFEPARGYGSACLAGIAALDETDIVAFIDGDFSDYPDDLKEVIEPVALGEMDLAIGSRSRSRSGLLWHQYWGNKLACAFIRLIHGHRFEDFGPMRCIRWSTLKALHMEDRDFGWTSEMQIKAARSGFLVTEVPVRYRKGLGKSKVSGTVKGSLLAGYKIIYWTVRLLFYRQNQADRI